MTTEELAQRNINAQIVLLNKIIDNQAWLISSAKSAASNVKQILSSKGVVGKDGILLPADQMRLVIDQLVILSGEWSKLGGTCEDYTREIRTAKETLNILK